MANNSSPTQDFVPVKEIRNGVLILKDGSMRVILIISSLNFGLKSDDEKMAIIEAYRNFLNSLDFTLQIFIRSIRLDIKPYLKTLEEQLANQNNDLLKIQIKEYIEFIKFFTENNDVMTKNFFVVVSYLPAIVGAKSGGLLAKGLSVLNLGQKNEETPTADTDFDENVYQLNQRVAVVQNGLGRVGLRSEILGTEELVELFFKIFNPGEDSAPSVEITEDKLAPIPQRQIM